MRHIKVEREFIVNLIIQAGEEIEQMLESHEVDRWVQNFEHALQEMYYFFPLSAEQVIYASEQIRRNMEERLFGMQPCLIQ